MYVHPSPFSVSLVLCKIERNIPFLKKLGMIPSRHTNIINTSHHQLYLTLDPTLIILIQQCYFYSSLMKVDNTKKITLHFCLCVSTCKSVQEDTRAYI